VGKGHDLRRAAYPGGRDFVIAHRHQ
jgi:hypothetical protein